MYSLHAPKNTKRQATPEFGATCIVDWFLMAAGRAIRNKVLPTKTGSIRALYRTFNLPGKSPLKGAHDALDAAVMDAYSLCRERAWFVSLARQGLRKGERGSCQL